MVTRKPNSRQVWPKVKTRPPLPTQDISFHLRDYYFFILFRFCCLYARGRIVQFQRSSRREPPTLSFCTAVASTTSSTLCTSVLILHIGWRSVGRLVASLKLVVDSRRGRRLLYPRYLPVKWFSLSTNLPRECLVWSGHESCGVWTRKGRPLHC